MRHHHEEGRGPTADATGNIANTASTVAAAADAGSVSLATANCAW
jgi:hypothetical protein